MKFNFKEIYIGECIRKRVEDTGISMVRICNFHQATEDEIDTMYKQKSMDTEVLLRWCKLLEYDFFRIYCQHLILFSPENKSETLEPIKGTSLPEFRKKLYTRQVIDFILELINTRQKTKLQIIEEYRIPKTTLYKWISKYSEME
ncbi:transposase [Chryseobacterium carnipullorum]|uniref:transposase n=1 Tax=Chryseobacterium carnipullorum TaxID=1124835 RepID=UPI000E9630EF|nr:transposase [Chryseobacterium carnipullorum]HBV16559.1 transposase [Chryseobacterium carnipullorum]